MLIVRQKMCDMLAEGGALTLGCPEPLWMLISVRGLEANQNTSAAKMNL